MNVTVVLELNLNLMDDGLDKQSFVIARGTLKSRDLTTRDWTTRHRGQGAANRVVLDD